jgi:glycosyltransferase involved in cell wall biosynthesis
MSHTDVTRASHAAAGVRHRIVSVPGATWNVSRARNVGIANSTGDVLILLDADIVVGPGFMGEHLRCHSSSVCAVAGAVASFNPYLEEDHVVGIGASLSDDYGGTRDATALDARWDVIGQCIASADLGSTTSQGSLAHVVEGQHIPLPWAFFWSGNVSIRRQLISDHSLLFDESFKGWGAEDMEWGFRAWQSGVPMLFNRHAIGIHLPHERDVKANTASEQANLCRLIGKHRCIPAEIVARYNDIEGNLRFGEIRGAVTRVFGTSEWGWNCAISVDNDGKSPCAVFGLRNEEARLRGQTSYRMLGVATWYSDQELECVQLTPRLRMLPEWLYQDVRREAQRIARKTVWL